MPSASCTDKRERNRAAKRRYYARNRETVIAKVREYHDANPEKRKASSRKSKLKNSTPEAAYKDNLKYKYGITVDEYTEMLRQQGDCCAICLVHQGKFRQKLSVDHDHSTGKVRGILCIKCNTILGHSRDDIQILNAAISYLDKHNGE